MPGLILEPLRSYREYPPDEMRERAKRFHEEMRRRRTVRDFSDRQVHRDVIEKCLLGAGTAPSGANLQPWHFTVITEPALKTRIRLAAEIEEKEFYEERAPAEWLDALAPLGTDSRKPFLEIAPILIAIFGQRHGLSPDGRRFKHYYVPESVGIATGFLIAGLHMSGLATLTHTPSPMNFLTRLCGRPDSEKPYLLLVVGYPAGDCMTPRAGGVKKALSDFVDWK